MKKKIGFLSNKLTLRGTEVAMYDYADFNETLLGNKSIIITRHYQDIYQSEFFVSIEAYEKFEKRFPICYYKTVEDINKLVEDEKIDVLYIIKSGINDHMITDKCKCCIHAVFESHEPHGDVFAVVGPTVNEIYNTNFPVVPHMIRLHDTKNDLRKQLGISEDTIVFGRYGGPESFDIIFVLRYIHKCRLSNVLFLFMNTNRFTDNPRCIFIEGSSSLEKKREFINTCDALLHARKRGETFGLTCGEFVFAGKPVITYGLSIEKTHLCILGDKVMIYNNEEDLDYIIKNFSSLRLGYDMTYDNPYISYSPENVMRIFENVFLE